MSAEGNVKKENSHDWEEIPATQTSSSTKSFFIENILTKSENDQIEILENKRADASAKTQKRTTSSGHSPRANMGTNVLSHIGCQEPILPHFQPSSFQAEITSSSSHRNTAIAYINAVNAVLSSPSRGEYNSLGLSGYNMWQQNLTSILSNPIPALRVVNSARSSLLGPSVFDFSAHERGIHNDLANSCNSCYPPISRISNASPSTSGKQNFLLVVLFVKLERGFNFTCVSLW